MIASLIYGGLGNQIFQYVYARTIANKLNVELKLNIDILLYNPYNYTPYPYYLDIFEGINEEIINDAQCANMNVIKEVYGKAPNEYEIKDNCLLDGYWQGQDFFDNEIIKKKLIFKKEIENNIIDLSNKIKNENSVSIHMRRGDYMNGNHFVDLSSTDYYRKAIEYIKQKNENCTFFVFSNDIEFAKEYFKNLNATFIRCEPKEDIYLMSLCKHSIIANSTFSWWGSLLGEKKKTIICPKKWHGVIETLEFIYPKGSILL